MKIICTGGAGFIGSHTAQLLEKRGHKVMVLDNFTTGKTQNLKGFHGKIQLGDITDMRLLEGIFDEFLPDAVIHLAAQSAITNSIAAPTHDLRINASGTINLLLQAKKHKVKRFVFSSTSAVYSEENTWFGLEERHHLSPQNPYGISKMAAEQYVRTMFPNHLIMRYGNVYGPRQTPIGGNQVIARALQHFIKGDSFQVNGHGKQKRDFVYVGDVADFNVEALTRSIIGTFNVASGKSYTVNEVLTQLEFLFDVPGYKWEHNNEIDPRSSIKMNVSKIYRDFGWKAYTPLKDGLQQTSDWWRELK
jgi:UDP-glucose 4-epimerase